MPGLPVLLLTLCLAVPAAAFQDRPQGKPDDESSSQVPDYLKPLLPQNFDKAAWTGRLNFHLHSKRSDGVLSPTEVVQRAYSEGVRELALTDHDSVDGVREACAEAKRLGVAFHTGIELTAGSGVHLLAFDVDIDHPGLAELMKKNRQWRLERAQALIKEINARPEVKKGGKTITIDEVLAKADGAPIGRPHIARVLVDKGLVKTADDAFQSYLKDNEDDVEKDEPPVTPALVLSAVHAAGGKVFFAHPYTADPKTADALFAKVDGIEGYRPSHARSPEGVKAQNARILEYLEAARANGVPVSPGSDFHDPEGRMNHLTVWMPKELASKLRDLLREPNRKALARLEAPQFPKRAVFPLKLLERLKAAAPAW